MNLITHVGRYSQLMTGVFKKPDKWNITLRQIVKEINKLGVDSLGITIIISVFIGSVITLQTVLNTANPLLPTYVTGLVTRDTLLLEFSSTILCLILAGKVGSNIASEINCATLKFCRCGISISKTLYAKIRRQCIYRF